MMMAYYTIEKRQNSDDFYHYRCKVAIKGKKKYFLGKIELFSMYTSAREKKCWQ